MRLAKSSPEADHSKRREMGRFSSSFRQSYVKWQLTTPTRSMPKETSGNLKKKKIDSFHSASLGHVLRNIILITQIILFFLRQSFAPSPA